MTKFYIAPFGEDGDLLAIPDDVQIDGSVSYESGFGIDYQKNLNSDPDAKAIPRRQFNQLMYDATKNIQQYQINGFPIFITTIQNEGAPYPYDIYSVVRYDGGSGYALYQSIVQGATTLPTNTTQWQPFPPVAAPPPPASAAMIFVTTPQSIVRNIYNHILFDTEYFDTNAYISGTGFVLNKTGIFQLSANICFEKLDSGHDDIFLSQLLLYKNGAPFALMDIYDTVSADVSGPLGFCCQGSIPIYNVSTTDVYQIYLYFTSGLVAGVYATIAGVGTNFSLQFVGNLPTLMKNPEVNFQQKLNPKIIDPEISEK